MELSEEEYEEIWINDVQDHLFRHAVADKTPVLLCVGAQPGAGKTEVGKAAERLHPTARFVFINGDDFRKFHPEYELLLKDPDPQAMPNGTADFSGWMVRRAIAHAAEHKYSVRVEGTFRDPAITLNTVRLFHDHGFDTHIVAIAVPEAVSWQGCVSRYANAADAGQAVRWAPKTAHDVGYEGTPYTVEEAEKDPCVGRITVMTRSGDVVYDNSRDTDSLWTDPPTSRSVLEYARTHPSQAMVDQFDVNQARLEDQAVRCGFSSEVLSAIEQTGRMGADLRAHVVS